MCRSQPPCLSTFHHSHSISGARRSALVRSGVPRQRAVQPAQRRSILKLSRRRPEDAPASQSRLGTFLGIALEAATARVAALRPNPAITLECHTCLPPAVIEAPLPVGVK